MSIYSTGDTMEAHSLLPEGTFLPGAPTVGLWAGRSLFMWDLHRCVRWTWSHYGNPPSLLQQASVMDLFTYLLFLSMSISLHRDEYHGLFLSENSCSCWHFYLVYATILHRWKWKAHDLWLPFVFKSSCYIAYSQNYFIILVIVGGKNHRRSVRDCVLIFWQ